MVRALSLKPWLRDPRLRTRSKPSLNLIPVVPVSDATFRLHLLIANWVASGHLGFLIVVVALGPVVKSPI